MSGGYPVQPWVDADVEAPSPPRGPGVAPPFAAPPTDRNRKAMWIGLGVGGLVLVLCCVGGVFGVGALVVSFNNDLKRQAVTVTRQYLDALIAEDYDAAYALQCASITSRQSVEEFEATRRDGARPLDYLLDEPVVAEQPVTVRAHVRYDNGERRTQRFELVADEAAGPLRVCGLG